MRFYTFFWCFIFTSFAAKAQINSTFLSFSSEASLANRYQLEKSDNSFLVLTGRIAEEAFFPKYRLWHNGSVGDWKSFYRGEHQPLGHMRTAVILEPFEFIEFKAKYFSPFSIRQAVFNKHSLPSFKRVADTNTSCICPKPVVVERNQWCFADCTPINPPDTLPPTHIIVHHTADEEFNSGVNYQEVMNLYWDIHVNSNGWDDIGYNWLIDPNGVIYKGRTSGTKGSHFSCMNDNTIGIALIGNYQEQLPSAAMLASLEALITWESCHKGISVIDDQLHSGSELLLGRISGHRDGNASVVGCPVGTACPGNQLYASLTNIKEAVLNTSCLVDSTVDVYYDSATTNYNSFISPGEEIGLEAILKVFGNQEEVMVPVHVLLTEKDSVLDSTSLLLGQQIVAISSDNNYSFTSTVVIPDTLIEGDYDLWVSIDATSELIELDECNNFFKQALEVRFPVSVVETAFEKPFTVYPNPTKGLLYSDISRNQYVFLYDMQGNTLLRNARFPIDFSLFPVGIYVLRVLDEHAFGYKKVIRVN